MKVIDISDTLVKSKKIFMQTRQLSKIKRIIIHHSASTTMTARDIAQYHVSVRLYPAIAYHFFITQVGIVFKTNRLEDVSWHTAKNNSDSISICLQGNFSKDIVPGKMYDNLVELISEIREVVNIKQICLHRDLVKTECPGKYFYPLMLSVHRKLLKNKV